MAILAGCALLSLCGASNAVLRQGEVDALKSVGFSITQYGPALELYRSQGDILLTFHLSLTVKPETKHMLQALSYSNFGLFLKFTQHVACLKFESLPGESSFLWQPQLALELTPFFPDLRYLSFTAQPRTPFPSEGDSLLSPLAECQPSLSLLQERLFDLIKRTPNLTILTIRGYGLSKVPRILKTRALLGLDFSKNNLAGTLPLDRLPRSLKHLDLSWNPGLVGFGTYTNDTPFADLKEVILKGTGMAMLSLPAGLFPALQTLDVSENPELRAVAPSFLLRFPPQATLDVTHCPLEPQVLGDLERELGSRLICRKTPAERERHVRFGPEVPPQKHQHLGGRYLKSLKASIPNPLTPEDHLPFPPALFLPGAASQSHFPHAEKARL